MKNSSVFRSIIRVLREKRGSSMIMALAYFLFVSIIITAIVTAIMLNIRRTTDARDERQADAAAVSAVRLLRQELSPLTGQTGTENIFLRGVSEMAGRIAAGQSGGEVRNYRLETDAEDRTVTTVQIQVSETRRIRCIVRSVCGDSLRIVTLTYLPENSEKWKTPTVSDGGSEYWIGETENESKG